MDLKRRKWFERCIICLMVAFLTVGINVKNIAADSEEIRSIDVYVFLYENGTADITQVWDVKATKGTEYYIPQTNLGDMKFEHFIVWDERGVEFTFEEEWDVERDIRQKAYRCGIHATNDGVELCWGIGSYGDHIYTLNYRLTNLLKAYDDVDGFNSRFVNDQLSAPVDRASVTIEKEGHLFSEEEVKMWAFGFVGEVVLEEGKIVARSSEPLDFENHMTVMTSYEKGVFQPVSKVDGSFEQVKERAFEGSDYEKADQEASGAVLTVIFGMLTSTILPILIFIFLLRSFFLKRGHFLPKGMKLPKYKETDYYRQLPLEGDERACLGVLSGVENVPLKNVLSAYFLKWIRAGAVQVGREQSKGFLRQKEEAVLRLDFSKKFEEPQEEGLFLILKKASGSDQTLQEKEFRKWSKQHYTELENWWDEEKNKAEQRFLELGGLEFQEGRFFFGLLKSRKKVFTMSGLSMLEQVWGFKRYLDDFSLIEERQSVEVTLWEEYLVFAAIFGIAEKVFKELKKLYPNFDQDLDDDDDDDLDRIAVFHIIHTISAAGETGMNSGKSAAEGGGGSSSSGGGGGFSGGGSGGGSR